MSNSLGHRSKMDIMWTILDFINREGVAGKTHVLYAANLNSRSFKKFINELIGIGAIKVRRVDGRTHYTMTTYGYKLLYLLTNVREILNNKSLVRAKIFTNKAMSEVIRNKLKFSDDNSIDYGKCVYGESDLEYIIDIIESDTGSYAVLSLSSNMNKEDVVNVLGKGLLILIDTDLKCIFVISHNLDHIIPRFRNLFNKLNIDYNRYMFIVVDEQYYIN